ncbi:inter-alpha-trypsin inhibitor heavy chain H3-like [Gambusia affinis]|uniref:inter-alpha-trypsin inhibitor heavy chain H3-like n=1 Tax=Gambusia affinis TaxID=33528 RepID=UPI001CDCADE0|nr:inter-alpha-trypsin inhibitor heavy chain H3-like [Gambusia affinis]
MSHRALLLLKLLQLSSPMSCCPSSRKPPDSKAHISFSPTAEQQRCAQCPQGLINGDFIIKYDVKREKGFGEIQVVNGYFDPASRPKRSVKIGTSTPADPTKDKGVKKMDGWMEGRKERTNELNFDSF